MITLDGLHEVFPMYVYPKGHTVSFDAIRDLVSKTASEFNVPIAFEIVNILTGNVPSFVMEDCLVICHPEHLDDYFKFVFRIERESNTAYIRKYVYGAGSPLNEDEGICKMSKEEQNYYRALMAIFKYIMC